MNVGTLEFMKFKKKNNKDEIFSAGYLLGMQASYELFAEMNGASKEESQEIVDDVFTNEKIEAIWDSLAKTLELDVRDPDLVGLIKQ